MNGSLLAAAAAARIFGASAPVVESDATPHSDAHASVNFISSRGAAGSIRLGGPARRVSQLVGRLRFDRQVRALPTAARAPSAGSRDEREQRAAPSEGLVNDVPHHLRKLYTHQLQKASGTFR